MSKIFYITMTEQDEKNIHRLAREAGVDVTMELLDGLTSQEMLRAQVRDWESRGAEVILCKGIMEKAIRPLAESAYVLGMRFSFDTSLTLLADYEKLHPGFFREKSRRVLMLSNHRIPLNQTLLQDLFQAQVSNRSPEEWKNPEDLASYAAGFDLVISGQEWIPLWKKHRTPYFYKPFDETISLQQNLLLAEEIAQSRRLLQEKKEAIQTILDNSFHAILTLDCQGTILQGNGQVKRYFKKAPAQLEGESIHTLLPQLTPQALWEAMAMRKDFYGEVLEYEDNLLVMNSFFLYQGEEVSGIVLNFEELRQTSRVEQKLTSIYQEKGLVARYTFDDILGASPQMEEVKGFARKFALHDANILLCGESGTGKELFAQSIHHASPRREGPFVSVNCGAFPESLLESELFGYAEGAFTGASRKGKKGLFELANHGTIFLDEIGEMNLSGQVRLLRVLEERAVTRIGDDRVIPVDVRIVAASNKKLFRMVEEGRFREDLYYRLNVLMLNIPPLRERQEDILLLAEHFLEAFGQKNQKQIELTPEARQVLNACPWKGNVRQLRNFCERLVIVTDTRTVSGEQVRRHLAYLDPEIPQAPAETGPTGAAVSTGTVVPSGAAMPGRAPVPTGAGLPVPSRASDPELARLLDALNQTGGNRAETAALLGISTSSLWRRMKKYQLTAAWGPQRN